MVEFIQSGGVPRLPFMAGPVFQGRARNGPPTSTPPGAWRLPRWRLTLVAKRPNTGPWTRLPGSSQAAVLAVMSALHRRGLQVVQSFDLRQALGIQGSSDVDALGCQYVVLLAYSEEEGPVVVTAHADAQSTNFRVLPGAGSGALPRLQVQVEIALQTLALTWRAKE